MLRQQVQQIVWIHIIFLCVPAAMEYVFKSCIQETCVGQGAMNENSICIASGEEMFSELHKRALALGLKQHHFNRLQYVKDKKRARTKQLLNYPVKGSLVLAFLVLAMSIVWFLDWPVQRQSLARIWWKFQGEKSDSRFVESEPCLVRASTSTQNLARPPIDCEFCRGVSNISRVSNLDPEDFERKFAYSGQPVIVQDGAMSWSAVNVFNFDFFKGIYSPGSSSLENVESQCQFFPYKTDFRNLEDVFQMDQSRAQLQDGSDPWYIGWSNCDITAGNILRKHYDRPYFLPQMSEASKTDWIFMGSPGYGAHMHLDNVGLPSWQAQITGHKLWTLEPPPECYNTCVGRLSVTVHPGEIIVLDTNKWFHSTLNVGEDISITIGSEFD